MRWQAGDVVALIGGGTLVLGGSEYLSQIHGLTAGRPPALDLEEERRVQEAVRSAIADGVIRTAHDCSEGGLALALAEMAIVSGTGVIVEIEPPPGALGRLDEQWFGEAPSRIIIACRAEDLDRLTRRCQEAGVAIMRLGTAGGEGIVLGRSGAVSLDLATRAYEGALISSS
jgi:phosphoribosylformylglycinamidine synthase